MKEQLKIAMQALRNAQLSDGCSTEIYGKLDDLIFGIEDIDEGLAR